MLSKLAVAGVDRLLASSLTSAVFNESRHRFIDHLTDAYPEVPWVFVFRDPVEVMVSNLKSFAGAPCVRIPRQTKLRENGKITKKKSPHLAKQRASNKVGNGKVLAGGGVRARRLEVGEPNESDGVVPSSPRIEDNALVRRRGSEGHDAWGSLSWNGETGEYIDSLDDMAGAREMMEYDGELHRSLLGRAKASLTKNMTMECADWLQVRRVAITTLYGARC